MNEQVDELIAQTTSLVGRLSSLETFTRRMSADLSGEMDAVAYLRAVLKPVAYIPPAGGWAAQYKTIAYLVGCVLESVERGELLELGGGVSTIWVGMALKARGSGHLTSVDHDENYAERTRHLIAAHGLEDFVDVVEAPLVMPTDDAHGVAWYDIDRLLNSLPEIGLLFIDGPPGTGGPLAREPAFAKVSARLLDDALVFLDDVDRPGEQEILERWLADGCPAGSLHVADRIGRTAVLRFVSNDRSPVPTTDQ